MKREKLKVFGSKVEFAAFGKSTLAYTRQMNSDEIRLKFPDADDLPEGVDLWALFGADGEPLAIADEQDLLIDNAESRSLLAVSLQ